MPCVLVVGDDAEGAQEHRAVVMVNEITERERVELTDLEGVIDRGIQTFVEVGAALSLIREKRLYRASHETFEDYCKERWGWTDRRARQLMAASKAVTGLETGTVVPPTNEAQARELVRVPEEKRAEVWEEAVRESGGNPTANAVKKAAERTKEEEPSVAKVAKDGPLFSDVVREAMAANGSAEEVAKARGIHVNRFRRARYILALHSDERMTAAQAQTIRRAIDEMNAAGTVPDDLWKTVEPIVEAVFGDMGIRRGAGSMDRAAELHAANFTRAFGMLMQVCMAAPDISVPLLHQEDRARIKSEIGMAIDKLKDLRQRVGRGGTV